MSLFADDWQPRDFPNLSAAKPGELVGLDTETKDPELKAKFAMLAGAVRGDKCALRDPTNQRKVASTIAALDKTAGFPSVYNQELFDPYRTVYNTTKLAAGMIELAGRKFAAEDLARIPASLYEDSLGDDVMRDIAPGGRVDPKVAAQILETLPADMKATFVRNVKAAGL